MIQFLTSLLVSISRRWWAVLLVTALNFASFQILFGLEDQFETLTAVPVFDTQNDLTPSRIIAQLPLYQGPAREAYLRFAVFDFVFPLIAGIFVATLWTLLLRTNSSPFAQRLLQRGVPLFALIGTLWDWLENISILALLQWASPDAWILSVVVIFKRLKLLWLLLNGPITAALFLLWATNFINRFRRKFQTIQKIEGAE